MVYGGEYRNGGNVMKRMVGKEHILVCLCVVLAVTMVGSSRAGNYFWDYNGQASWFIATNWTDNKVPVAGDNAYIAMGAPVIDAAANPDIITVGNSGDGSLVILPGADIDLLYDLRMGTDIASDDGTVTMTGGALDGRYLWLGGRGTGTITMSGGIMTFNQYVWLGQDVGGRGTLNISGGTLQATGTGGYYMCLGYKKDSTANVTVSGTGTLRKNVTTTYLAYGSNTTCNFQQTGGNVLLNEVVLGADSSGTGYTDLDISGGTFIVGSGLQNYYGDGTITVSGNGTLRVTNTVILAGSVHSEGVDLEQSGGTIDIGAELYLANADGTSNRMTLSGGTTTVHGISIIGRGAGSIGEAVLTNTAVWNISGGLRVCDGSNGTGVVTVAGGTLKATNSTVIVAWSGVGTLNVVGGTVNCNALEIGKLSGAIGSVILSSGMLQTPRIFKGSGTGVFTFSGGTLSIAEYDSSMGDMLNAGGTVSPGGAGIGVMTNEAGNYTEMSSACVIDVQIGGITQGTGYDAIRINKQTTLAGKLCVSLANGFEESAQSNDEFYIIEDWNGYTVLGAFNNVASGERITTRKGHSFAVYYGAGVIYPWRVTMTEFLRASRGTAIIIN